MIGEREEVSVLDRARHRILLRSLAQDDGLVREDHVHRCWQVGLSVRITGGVLTLEDDDRGKPVCQLLLRGRLLPGKGSSLCDEQCDQAEDERHREARGEGSRSTNV
jgi:hypothetical protein